MDGETHDGFGKQATVIQCDNQGAARLGYDVVWKSIYWVCFD